MLPALGSTLALAAVVGGGLVLHPELLDHTAAAPATTAAAATTNTGGTAAARATVTSGMDPVTGAMTGAGTTPSYTVDSSLLGVPWVPGPSSPLPELTLRAPGPGVEGGVETRTRSEQFGHTTQWTAKPQVDGPVRRIVKTVAEGGYIVVPNEAGDLHLLCGGVRSDAYYVDSHAGEWRVFRVDGGTHYDVSYRFVQFDRSPMSLRTTCQ
jgi:hypothetical protein